MGKYYIEDELIIKIDNASFGMFADADQSLNYPSEKDIGAQTERNRFSEKSNMIKRYIKELYNLVA